MNVSTQMDSCRLSLFYICFILRAHEIKYIFVLFIAMVRSSWKWRFDCEWMRILWRLLEMHALEKSQRFYYITY